MQRNIEEITKEVIGLPNNERLQLVKKILQLDNQSTDSDIDSKWQEEITNRVLAVENGTAKGIDFKDSIQSIKNRIVR